MLNEIKYYTARSINLLIYYDINVKIHSFHLRFNEISFSKTMTKFYYIFYTVKVFFLFRFNQHIYICKIYYLKKNVVL